MVDGVKRRLVGTAVFSHGRQACRLDYSIECDERWQTRRAQIEGWRGNRTVDLTLVVDRRRRWRLNDRRYRKVEGSVDVDLQFSPSTNLLPIRRLGLAVGEEARVRTAWLRFPSLTLEPLDQVYRRLGRTSYRYESGGGRFSTTLRVNAAGLVTDYPNLWKEESG